MHRTPWQLLIILVFTFCIRFFLSFLTYNNDIHNHIAWMESVRAIGWSGLYDRDLSPYAQVNYPPLTLYTFYVGEQIYQAIPSQWHSLPLHTSLYKLPSILADCLVAYLLWRFTPFSRKARSWLMAVYLLNPALMLNSVFWGQIESLSALSAIVCLLALINKRGDLALITFVCGLLIKQNILPLFPLLITGLYTIRPPLKNLISALGISFVLTILAYLPLLPPGANPILSITSTYMNSIGGQPHQHLATVNALNLWYLLGFNQLSDASLRLYGLTLTGLGLAVGLYWFYRISSNTYLRFWTAVALISLTTFVFATRMHERHSYMAVAYLIFLLPYRSWRWVYVVVSGISFYNILAVWLEYFAIPPSPAWLSAMAILSGIMVATSLYSLLIPQFFHQDRIKPKIMDRGEA